MPLFGSHDLVNFLDRIRKSEFADQRVQLKLAVNENLMLGTDSVDYHQLSDAVQAIKDVPGIVCEIGVREGGSSQVIMQTLGVAQQTGRTFIALDPYGHIPYVQSEDATHRNDYTNRMRNNAMTVLYYLAEQNAVNFIFMNLEDTEYFRLFPEGFPIYDMEKKVENTYALVHFDGPHSLATTRAEMEWFMPRTTIGSMFVFDNTEGYYDHTPLKEHLLSNGWELVDYTKDKGSYRRVA